MPLTKRQREILDFLTSYSEQNGYAPSFEEIARQFNYNSLATVHEHLTNLERKGYIKRAYNESRAIEILPSEVNPRAVELPLLGSVAAGMPIEEVRSIRDDIEQRVLDLADNRIELIREDRRQHMMRMARLVPGLVEEFGGRLTDEEIRAIADDILDTYEEVPIRSFVMTLANRRAREILKQRAGETVGA